MCDCVRLLDSDTVRFHTVLSNKVYDFFGKMAVHRSQWGLKSG